MTVGIVRCVGVMLVPWLTALPSVDGVVLEEKVERADVPVLLVPGWFDTGRDMAALRIRLIAAGWEADHVQTVTFSDPVGTNRLHAIELGQAIDSMLQSTGADELDVVAHSMGGLATRWYLRETSDERIRRVAFIGSPNRGTLSAHLAWGGGRAEMMPGSAFLDTLNTDAPAPSGVEAMTIRTRVDTHIVPGESATLPGVPDYEICCPTHSGLLASQEVFELVRAFLQGGASGASPPTETPVRSTDEEGSWEQSSWAKREVDR